MSHIYFSRKFSFIFLFSRSQNDIVCIYTLTGSVKPRWCHNDPYISEILVMLLFVLLLSFFFFSSGTFYSDSRAVVVGRVIWQTKVTCVGSATEMKSDRSKFIFRPFPCKRMKRNVWRPIRTHTGLSSSHSAAVVYVVSEAKNVVSVAMKKLNLPWANWYCRESKLKLPWHFWAIVLFKQDNKKSIYLDLMKNTNHRRIVAKFRTSNHKLMILIQEILHAQNSWGYQIVSNTVLK